MVNLSKTISAKIKEKQGEITEDETIQFKSYLLSLGIPDPVTRSTHGSGVKYYQELAREVSSSMESILKVFYLCSLFYSLCSTFHFRKLSFFFKYRLFLNSKRVLFPIKKSVRDLK